MDTREIEKICPFCDEVFSFNEIKSHIGIIHLGIIPQIEIAPEDNLENGQSVDHNTINEESKTISIPTIKEEPAIKEEITIKEELKTKPFNQRKIHSEGRRRYQCKQCDQSYAFPQSLRTHVRVEHEGSLTFRCDFCNKNFSKDDGLKRHIKYHCPKTRIQMAHTSATMPKRKGCSGWCQTCNKTFGNLRQHVRVVHEKVKFFCDICPKAYCSKDRLKIHIAKHMGIKPPFECNNCEKKYFDKRDLTKHIKVKHENSEHDDAKDDENMFNFSLILKLKVQENEPEIKQELIDNA